MVVRMVDAMSSKHKQEVCWSSQTADVRFSRKTMPPLETHVHQVLDSHQQRALIGKANTTTGRIRKHTVPQIQSWPGAVTSGEGNRGGILAGNLGLGTGVGEGAPGAGCAPAGEGYQVGIMLSDYHECALLARGGARVAQDAAESARVMGGLDEGRRQKWPQPLQSWENGARVGGGDGGGSGGGRGEIAGGASSSPWGGAGLAEVLDVPREILELSSLKGVLSAEVWEKHLTESDRQYLSRFLPAGVNTREAVSALLAGRNLHFGNQFLTWSAALCHRELHPKVLQEKVMEKKRRRRAFYSDLRRYHRTMLGDLREMAGIWKDCRGPDQELVPRLRVWRRKKWEQGDGSEIAAGGVLGGEGGRQQQTSQHYSCQALNTPLSSSGRAQPQQFGSSRGHGDAGGSGSRGGGGGSADTGGRRSAGGDSAARRGAVGGGGGGGGGGSAESSGEQRFGEENWRIPKEAVAAANAAALAAYAEWNRRHGNSVSGPDPAELTRVLRVNKETMLEIAKRREAGEEVRWDSLKRLIEKQGGGEEAEVDDSQQQQQQEQQERQPRELKRRKNDAEREKSEKERFAQEKKRQEDHWQTLVHQDLPASQVLFMKFHREQVVIARWVAEQCAEKYDARFCRRQDATTTLLALPAPQRSVYL